MKSATFGLAACLAVGISGLASAQDLKGTQRLSETQIGFDPSGKYDNYTLTVTGPNGFHASASSKGSTPTIDLRRFGQFDDGNYNYNLIASSEEKAPIRTPLDNGRDGGPFSSVPTSVSASGRFQVKGGTIVKIDPAAREPSNKRAN